MDKTKITIIDETIREGMQHSGIVFTYTERKKILKFQEKLGVDICQAGYPPAHITEADNIKKLCKFTENKNYKIQIAGMGRAFLKDAKILIKTGINHFHLHANANIHVNNRKIEADKNKYPAKLLSQISETIEYIRGKNSGAKISIAILDIGKTDPLLLEKISYFFIHKLKIDILSLPDTSGIMAPNLVYDRIHPIAMMAAKSNTKISIHCHNDMGMASANTIIGIQAGAKIFEASVLGIGERNGIADIFTTGRILKNQGFDINLKTNNTETFRQYYDYVNEICKAQTGENLLNVNTPFFGDAVKTHVAGTHGTIEYGATEYEKTQLNTDDHTSDHAFDSQKKAYKEKFFLNLLCGKHLVEKYLTNYGINYNKEKIDSITDQIKCTSADLKRRLTDKEIKQIAEHA